MKTTTVAGVVRCLRVLWIGSMLYDQAICVDHASVMHLARRSCTRGFAEYPRGIQALSSLVPYLCCPLEIATHVVTDEHNLKARVRIHRGMNGEPRGSPLGSRTTRTRPATTPTAPRSHTLGCSPRTRKARTVPMKGCKHWKAATCNWHDIEDISRQH